MRQSDAARRAGGFTLFEVLLALGIMGIMAGLAVGYMPRILSGQSVASAARQLAGAGSEARQMAMLQQRPWELVLDLESGAYSLGPLGVLARLEGTGQSSATGMDGPDPARAEQSLALRARLAREQQKGGNALTLKSQRQWSAADAYSPDEDDALLTRRLLPEEVRVVRVNEGKEPRAGSRVSLVFSARGASAPVTLWVDTAEDAAGAKHPHERHTVWFPGLLPPEVARGFLLPDDEGQLYDPERSQASGERQPS